MEDKIIFKIDKKEMETESITQKDLLSDMAIIDALENPNKETINHLNDRIILNDAEKELKYGKGE